MPLVSWRWGFEMPLQTICCRWQVSMLQALVHAEDLYTYNTLVEQQTASYTNTMGNRFATD